MMYETLELMSDRNVQMFLTFKGIDYKLNT